MNTARITDTASPRVMTIINIIITRVRNKIMMNMNITAQERARVAQRVPKDPRVMVHGDYGSPVLDYLIYMYVAKRRLFVDSQPWKTILSLCLYSHFG